MTRQCGLLALSGSYGRGVHGAKIQGSGFPVACALSSAVTQDLGSDSLGVRIVFGDVRYGRGPKRRLPEESDWGRAGVSPPWWAPVEAQG